jgi:hypothetical protein
MKEAMLLSLGTILTVAGITLNSVGYDFYTKWLIAVGTLVTITGSCLIGWVISYIHFTKNNFKKYILKYKEKNKFWRDGEYI